MPRKAVRKLIHRVRGTDPLPGSRLSLGEIGVVMGLVVVIALAVIAWEEASRLRLSDAQQFSEWLTTYRTAWYALPVVALAFTALNMAFVPVLLMIAATGIAFGPWLGPPYAMVAVLTSGSAGFGIGRLAGRKRVENIGGERVKKLTRALERNGTLAVFFLRKVPAPFILANILAGAAGVRYRDFLAGTVLGMGAFVVALAGFGYQIRQAIRDPSPSVLLGASAFLIVPFTLAWGINRWLRAKHEPRL